MATIIATRKEMLASAKVQKAVSQGLMAMPISSKNQIEDLLESMDSESKFKEAVEELAKAVASKSKAFNVQFIESKDGNSGVAFSVDPEYMVEQLEIAERFAPMLAQVFNAVLSAFIALKSVFTLFKPVVKQLEKECVELEKKWAVKSEEQSKE